MITCVLKVVVKKSQDNKKRKKESNKENILTIKIELDQTEMLRNVNGK